MYSNDELNFYMNEAIKEANIAFLNDEVPIGCVIVYNDKIIGRGHNMRMKMKNPLYHAEIIAINEASKYINDWRLEECHMFVTVEPCQMCAGAVLQARMKSLTFGCENKKAGSISSVINILDNNDFNHKVIINKNILNEECSALMKSFFKKIR